LGAEGNLVCLNAETGKLIWAKDLKAAYQVKAPMWGFAAHPLLDGDRLVCLVGGDGTTVVALNKDTGAELWRSLSSSEPGYSSPAIFRINDKRQIIIFDPDSVNSLEPDTGRVLWSIPFKSNTGLSVATPRQMEDRLFFTCFYNGSLMLRFDSGTPSPTTLWRTQKASEKDTTHLNAIFCTPFLEQGYIYGVCSYGQLRCLNAATGARVWETFKATTEGEPVRWANAFIVKNGARFFLFNEKGDLIIAHLSPAGYEEISRAHILAPTNKDCGRLVVWSHPAFANRCVFARNDKEIICVDLAQK
ncbi:MAG TPA: PQQ-binding-like beta-propeller repeat protein, partial [Verrucomicrobiae bacterium]|nr:PQQ-binding-like beta-propeller repeat protein [Verrucomicrobiae bacterium]